MSTAKTPQKRREVWRTEWQWPWRHKQRTTEKTFLGLRRMQDRLQRCRVWVHSADEKYKASLEVRKRATRDVGSR